MEQLPIDANICEIDNGAYYPVKLHTVPRVGELINLFSFLDQSDGSAPVKRYEVVQVVHKLHDVSDKVPKSESGHQFASVYVKPSNSEYFE